MDIVQKSIFNRGIYEPPAGYYTPYNTPPYITPYTDSGNWLLEHQNQQQMQHIRFPTPPITPPRPIAGYGLGHLASSPVADLHQRRTQSVIMKAQHSQQDDLCPRSPLESQDDSKSCSSGSECGTTNDFICNWLECDR